MNFKEMFIEDLSKAHKFLSVQVAVLVGLVATASDYIPTIHDMLPEGWSKFAIAAIIFARLWKQNKDSK